MVRSTVAGKENVKTDSDGVIDFSDEQADTQHMVEHVVVGQRLVGAERHHEKLGHLLETRRLLIGEV